MAKKPAPKKPATKAEKKPTAKASAPKPSKSSKEKAKPAALAKSSPKPATKPPKSSAPVSKTVSKNAKSGSGESATKGVTKKGATKTAPAVMKEKTPANSKSGAMSSEAVVTARTPQLMTAAGKGKKASEESTKPTKSSEKMTRITASSVENVSKDEVHPQWYEFYRKHHQAPAQSYDMKGHFESQAPLLHKVLGWGWVLSNDNDRLEVLFKDGKRMLISNYKSPS